MFKMPTTAALGDFRMKHDTTARVDFYAGNTGQAQTLRFKNVGSLSDEDADAAVFPVNLEINGAVFSNRQTFVDNDTSPDVTLSQFWLANNSGGTSITTFNGGVAGMVIHIVANNINTTLVDSATTTGLSLKGGANKTLAQYEGISFIKNGLDWWIEV